MGSKKTNGHTETEVALSTSIHVHASRINPISNISDMDIAFQYIQDASNAHIDVSTVDLSALRWRIDLRILPILLLCSVLNFLDKVNINYAAVMGLKADLHLKGDEFSNISTAFYVAYAIFEVPNGLLLQKLPVAKWLGDNLMAWGIVTACTAATTNYTNLIVVRIVLGIIEAAITPSFLLITSQWYTRSEQVPRFSFWFSGLAFGQILGGFISFAFQNVGSKASLSSWRIMFVVLGVVTVLVGTLTAWTLPDTPMNAKWMNKVEKVALLNHLSENRTGIKNYRFKLSQVVELLLDVQMWLMMSITMLIAVSTGIIVSYSSTIIRSFGYTAKHSTLLNAPSGAVSLLAIIICSIGVTQITKGHRWVWIVASCIGGIVAGSLLSFSPSSNRAALLAGIYLVNCVVPVVVLVLQLTMANVAGNTKRSLASAMIVGSFSVGNIIGPQTFRAQAAPQYHTAKVIFLATQAGGGALAFVLFGYYVLANRQKERRQKELMREGVNINSLEDTWGNLTDKENVEFRYTY